MVENKRYIRMKITNKDFVPLHCHSEFSHFDGLAPVNKLVMKAREMGFEALGLTDHGNIGGLVNFINACTAKKDKDNKDIPYATLKPILGLEAYMSSSHLSRSKDEQPNGRKGNHHIILLAANFKGYQNICNLSHISWTEGFYFDPRIDFDLLAKYSEGVICSTACLAGIVNTNLMYDRKEQAEKACKLFKEIFGHRFFLEIMYHGIPVERDIIPDIVRLSKKLDIPMIATQDSHYLEKSQAASHEVLLAMSTGKCLKDPKRLKFPYDEFYLKSAEEMMKIFNKIPQAVYNTKVVADMTDFDDIKKNLFVGMRLPKIDIPNNKTSLEYLSELAWKGIKDVGWENSKLHVEALKKELEDIKIAWENNGYDFATYFLIVWDLVNFARSKGILTSPGRGSGYGSILLRCLRVTYGVDPIYFDCLWERFMGFDFSLFIKRSDFGFTKMSYLSFSLSKLTAEEMGKNILLEVEKNGVKEDLVSKIKEEIEKFEITNGLNDINNLKHFYSEWEDWKKAGSHQGDKNEINSWTAYCLGMTVAKPTGTFLPARRAFARASYPDVDIDFDYFYQQNVQDYIVQKYGKEKVAKIGVYQGLKLKSTLRRIGKALDIAQSFHLGKDRYITDNETAVSELISTLPKQMGANIKVQLPDGGSKDIKTVEDAYRYCPDFKQALDQYPDIRKYARNIEGLLTIYSTHPAGVCLSGVPLASIAPVRRSREGFSTQYTYENLEQLGIVKLDILALSTLAVVKKTLDLVKETYGLSIDIENLPLDDAPTLELYRTGKLKGVFQCETYPMQQVMKDIGVDRFDDIVAAIALFRPGSMASIPEYCARKRGEKDIDYFHPSIEKYVKPYLKKSYGILIYQESLMQVCNSLAGFSIQDGYIMIKAVGKKKLSLLKKFEKQFVDGCVKNNVPKNVAQEYWTRFITPFAAYGFNKSHAICYGFLSLLTAYLKANFTDEFFCSLLNVENLRKNHDKIIEYEKDAIECGIIIAQKDLNKCDVEYRIIKKRDPKNGIQNTVISPSLMIKNVGKDSAMEIASKRPFKDLRDLAGRTETRLVDKEIITSLVQDGFFDQEYHTELGKGKKISKTKFREALIAKFLAIRNDLKKLGSKGMPDFDLFEGE